MIKRLHTAPAQLPISLDEIKDQLRLEYDYTREDAYLNFLAGAAKASVENHSNRALITQTWQALFSSWDELQASYLPLGKLQSVSSLVYLNEDGVENTVLADDYIVEGIGTDNGKIVFPSTSDFDFLNDIYESYPICATYICGYGDTSEVIPEEIKQVLLLYVTHFYENREPVSGKQEETLLKLIEQFCLRNVF